MNIAPCLELESTMEAIVFISCRFILLNKIKPVNEEFLQVIVNLRIDSIIIMCVLLDLQTVFLYTRREYTV